MAKLFVIRNQNNHFLGKDKIWHDGSEPQQLFRSKHRDMALNELFEVTLDDSELRGEVLAVRGDSHDHPQVEVLNPIPRPETSESTVDEDSPADCETAAPSAEMEPA